MIVLVWSLVSSVVEAARRRRLATFLRHFYDDPANRKNMLICKRIRQMDTVLSPSPSSARLTRFTSEPHLNTQQLIYRTERAELAVEKATALHPSEWRFVDIQNPQAGQKVYFVASIERCDDEHPAQTVFLDSCCDRVAWNRLQPASLYACDFEQFVDIVYAFSEGALFENNSSALVESIHTIFPDTSQSHDLSLLPTASPARSCHSSSSVLALTQQRPMPLLQQLFWGDKDGVQQRATMRYGSETALHNGGHYGSLPRRTTTGSPSRRRYRSCTSSSRSSKDLFQELGYEYGGASRFFDTSYQLPPFLRNLEKEKTYSLYNGNTMEHKTKQEQSSGRSVASSGISPSVTIEGIDLGHMDEDLAEIRSITADLPYVDDSTATSPLAITDSTSSYAALVYRELAKRTAEGGLEGGDRVTSEQEEPSHEIQVKVNGQHANGALTNGSAVREVNGSQKSLEEDERRIVSKPPPSNGSVRRNKRAESSCPPSASISRRRHSAMVQSLADTTFNFSENGRHRSVSPMPGDTLNGRRRSLRNSIFADSGSIELPRPYTPSRRFYCRRTSVTEKTMSKPPSILVYTGDQKDLYSRIRRGLSRVLPSDRYTVFNISAEAVRKQPWIEKTTACLLIACTDGLDDMSWNKMQTYFNQAGKIIFVCQNRLLSSLTNCESSKKQADILRMALGHNNSGGMGKDFEHFLKKSLKTLNKQGVVNETFRSKDLAGGVSYSVVLTKTNETPLLLYMENSAHQAAAMFSDATPDQLLAPGSKILRDSLSRVGVLVHEHEVTEPTQGLLLAQEDGFLDQIQGMRFGENIGKSPQLFLRKEGTVVEQGLPSPSRELLPIQVGQSDPSSYEDFNFSCYFRKLSTNRLGRVCLHVPVTTTTMDVMSSFCDAVPCLNGAVVIAGQQIHGQGRGGNEFISPLGAAMFTVSVEIPKSSQLAKRPSFIQHIFAVAIVDAVHSLSGMDDFPLRIKWPNDFYYNRSHKMGGLLATANFRDNSIAFTLGAGLNVTNSQPTVCLNDIAPEGQDVKFTIEEVIAETMNKFEIWLNRYELKGANEFLNKYYEYWLHDREEVLLEECGDKVIIRGLDEHGYLQVRSKRNPGKLISVMDNGNTFDMMKGLIRQKL